MLGYSDSSKESGLVYSRWALYRIQTELAKQARERGIRLRLFHGRGGSPSRGGGSAHETILAQPPGTVADGIKVTEQGEVITAKFAERHLAVRSLEQTISAVCRAGAASAAEPPADWVEAIAAVAERSRSAYERLLTTDGFSEMFRECTPIDVLGELNIGSRPVSRPGADPRSGLRAIPWVFSWTQSRVGIPSWYGAGSGLEAAELAALREMWRQWPFFHHLVSTLQDSLAAADLWIGRRYLELAKDRRTVPRPWRMIERERERCERRIEAITGHTGTEDRVTPADGESRRGWLDALSFMQIELLRRHRAGDRAARDPLLNTIAGLAAGLRGTG
jgi:phosphoenolpyruvate carboxylase